MAPLAPPRRIVSAHTVTGASAIIDDTPIPFPLPTGLNMAVAYVQTSFPAQPVGLEGASTMPPGFYHPEGVSVTWIDIPAGKGTGMHYTNTIDYVVVLAGTLKYTTHDGVAKVVHPGDLVVQAASVHDWSNETAEDARILCVTLPSKPVQINDKGLDEAVSAYKLA